MHRRELVEQARQRFAAFGVNAGVILAGYRPNPFARVQIASIQTLARRKNWPQAGLVIIDECHHASSDTWRATLAEYPDAFRLGLTATPYRLDGKPLGGDLFGQIVAPVTALELCESGVLVKPRVFSYPIPKVDVSVRGGDYVLGALGMYMRQPKLVGGIVEHWKKHDPARAVIFATTIEHSRALVDAFPEGIAEHIDGKTPKPERDAILTRLRSGKTRVVSNCQVLTEGWDLPALECAILARPTKSLGLYKQMVGRIMRSFPNKTGALLLDHAGNVFEHGHPLNEVEFSLTDKTKVVETCPVRLCPHCFAQIPVGLAECPECNFIATAEDTIPPVEDATVELVEVPMDQKRDERDWYVRRVQEADEKRFKIGWARRQYFEKFGRWPSLYKVEKENYRCFSHQTETNEWGQKKCVKCRRTV